VRWAAVAALFAACARPPPGIDAPPLVGIYESSIFFQAVLAVAYEDGTVVRREPKSGYARGVLSQHDRDRLVDLAHSPAFSARRWVEVEDIGLRDMGCHRFNVRDGGFFGICEGEFSRDNAPELVRLTRRAAGSDVSEVYDLLVTADLGERRPFVATEATVCGASGSCPALRSGCEWPSWLPRQNTRLSGDRLRDLEALLRQCESTLGCIDHRLVPNTEEARLYRPRKIYLRQSIPGAEQLFPSLAVPDEVCGAE